MPEIIIEISLNRSSGVLAGIVASLAQAGIELQSQKLKRSAEGRGGWLTVVGSGDSPAPAALAERLNGTVGVEKLMRIIVDGEAVLAEGKPLADQIRHDDLAELSAGSDGKSDESSPTPDSATATGREGGLDHGPPGIEDLPILSEAEPETGLEAGQGESADRLGAPEPHDILSQASAGALDDDLDNEHNSAATPGPSAQATDHLRKIAEADPPSASETPVAESAPAEAPTNQNAGLASAGEQGDDPAQVGALLRRRRRRRR